MPDGKIIIILYAVGLAVAGLLGVLYGMGVIK